MDFYKPKDTELHGEGNVPDLLPSHHCCYFLLQANIREISVEISSQYHNSIIGAKGRLIQSVMQECGGVIIRFPPENTKSNKVTIRGPSDDVEQAKKQLLELADERVSTESIYLECQEKQQNRFNNAFYFNKQHYN